MGIQLGKLNVAWKSRLLVGKRVLVVGGSSGIGEAVAREALRRGAEAVCVIGRRPIRETTLGSLGDKVHYFQADVTDSSVIIEKLGEAHVAAGEKFDLGFCMVGSLAVGPIDGLSVNDMNAYVTRNLTALMYLFDRAKLYMAADSHFAITSSMSARWRYPMPLYCLVKDSLSTFATTVLRQRRVEAVGENEPTLHLIEPGFVYGTGIAEDDNDHLLLSSRMLWVIQKLGISPERCARNILTGVAWKHFRILPTWDAKLSTYLHLDSVFGGFITVLLAADKKVQSPETPVLSRKFGRAFAVAGGKYLAGTLWDLVKGWVPLDFRITQAKH
jgi:NAD(P)-dependent dehydrogenase (short-subunit alcohol dehydrogenase family)